MQPNEIQYRCWEKGKMNHYALRGGLFMLWTGKKDQYGKKIYEGDIVRIVDLIHGYQVFYVQVKYDRKQMKYNLADEIIRGRNIIVIGHIFENKEKK